MSGDENFRKNSGEVKNEKCHLLKESEDDSEKQKLISSSYCQTVCGIVAVCGITMCKVISISCLQLMEHPPPEFELNFLRFAAGILFNVTFLTITRTLPRIERKKWVPVLIVAFVTLTSSLSLYNKYVKMLPVSGVFGIRAGLFLLQVSVLSRIVLKHSPSTMQLILTNTALIGVSLVIYSSFNDGSEEKSNAVIAINSSVFNSENISSVGYLNISGITSPDSYTPQDKVYLIFAALTLFGNALSDSIEVTVISISSLKETNAAILSFWYFLCGMLFSIPPTMIFEKIIVPQEPNEIILVIVHSVSSSGVTFLAIVAIQLLLPSIFSVLQSSEIPVALTCQMFLLHTVTPPVDLLVFIVGLLIITVSVLGISLLALKAESE